MSTDPRIRYQRAIARAEDLPRSARHIAVLIGCHLNAQLVGAVALAALMVESGYSRPTVLRATKRLREDGWLRVVTPHRRGRATVYAAEVPALFRLDEVSAETPEPAHEVSPVTPHPLPGPVERPDGVSLVIPHLGDGVSPVRPQPPVQVSPLTPLVVRTNYVRTGEPDEVSAVVAALPRGMGADAGVDVRRYHQPIAQRLAAGWTQEQLVAATAALQPLPHLINPVGWWCIQVSAVPPVQVSAVPPVQVSAPAPEAPRPRCTRSGHEHAVVTAAGCSACRVDALAATS